MPPRRSPVARTRLVVGFLMAGAVGCVVVALALGTHLDWTFADFVRVFVVSNGLIGLSFASCGAVIAWHRSTNPVGWLMLAGGLAQSISAVAAPLAATLNCAEAPEPLARVAADVYMFCWPWSIGLFMPLTLLVFPSGRLPAGRAWRWIAGIVVVTAPLFVAAMVLDEDVPGSGVPNGYLAASWHDSLSLLWSVSDLRTLLAFAVGVVALVVRFRQAREDERHQIGWLLAAAALVLALIVPWTLVDGTPIAVLFAIPLIPAAIAVAILRYQLLDIRRVVSRLEESRKRVIAGREEERRRLRRDLHDGVGPSLTGIAMNADAAVNLLDSDPQTAGPLMRQVAADTRESIAEIRRIIEGLRPSVLDGSDLVEAIRLRADALSSASDGLAIEVTGPTQSRQLRAAVEDAAYRIATEALNNIVKHSSGTRAEVTVRVGAENLDIVIADDGRAGEPWEPGVGLGAMAERAAELGGRCAAGPTGSGGRVHAVIPLASP